MKKKLNRGTRQNDETLITLMKFSRRQLLSILQFAPLPYRERYYSWCAGMLIF